MFRKAVLSVLTLAAFATMLVAESKPNFSGTWKLNVSKSSFDPLPPPDSRTDVIDHTDPAMKVSTSSKGGPTGDLDATANYTTDGKEAVNQIGPIQIKSTLGWEGSNLVVNSKFNFQDNDIAVKNTWTLSEDGKTLTENAHITAPMGEFDQKLVFDKQDGAAATATTAKAPTAAPATTAVAGNAAKPNFSGTWKLDVSKSDFGVMPPDNSRTYIIEHNDPAIKVAVSADGAQGKQDFTINLTTDGKEAINNVSGLELKSILNWEGNNLIENIKLKYQDNDVTVRDVWGLSADGKTLTHDAHFTSPMGEMDQKLVFAKATP